MLISLGEGLTLGPSTHNSECQGMVTFYFHILTLSFPLKWPKSGSVRPELRKFRVSI